MQDLKNNLDVVQSITPDAYTASQNGSSADLQNRNGAMAVIDAGAYTDGSHVFEVQESDDDSVFTAVADADLEGTEPTVDAGGDANQTYRIGYKGSKRYLRVITTVTGTTTGAKYAATIVRGHPRKAPV